MFCRCRFLRAYHEAFPRTFTRPTFGISTRYASNSAPDSLSPSPPEKSQNTDAADKKSDQPLRGSTQSLLAFKPLPVTSFLSTMDEPDLEPPNSYSPEEAKRARDESWTLQNMWKRQRQRAEAESYKDPETAIHEWNHLRTTQKKNMVHLSAIKWTLIAIAGCQLDSADVISNFARDLVEAHQNSSRVQATMISKVLHRLIFPGGRRVRMDSHPTFQTLPDAWFPSEPSGGSSNDKFHRNLDTLVMSMYKQYYLNLPKSVDDLPPQIVIHFGLIAIRTKNINLLLEGPLLPAFLSRLKKGGLTTSLAFPSLSPIATVRGPAPEVFPLYRLIQKSLNKGSERHAFQMFQQLVKNEFISSNAISQIKLDGGDLKEIIHFAMVRSCLDYQWITGALKLLLDALQGSPRGIARSKDNHAAINEAAYLALKNVASISSGPTFAFSRDSPTGVARTVARHIPSGASYVLNLCLSLISGLRDTDKHFMSDDKVIQSFYELAQLLDAGPQAEALYSIGRYNLNSRHRHPSLPPFLTTAAFTKVLPVSTLQLSPTSPKYLPTPLPTIPILDANVDSVTSSLASQPDSFQYLPPHGAPLTWLLSYMATTSKNVHLSRVLANEVAGQDMDIPLLDRSRFIRAAASCGYAAAARTIWTRYSKGVNEGVVGHAATTIRLVGLFSSLMRKAVEREASKRKDEENGSHKAPEEIEMAADVEESSEDLRRFAELVVSAYRSTKEPLAEAVHQDLNALARAYFMTGNVIAGFDVLQMVMNKKEMPDLYDVNVALSGMAKYSPRQAGMMIESMIEKGLLPDAVSFGTVIQEAIIRGDNELMVDLVRRARAVDEGKLTFRTVAALVRTSVSDKQWPGTGDEEEQTLLLQVGKDGPEGQLILGGNDLGRMKTNLETAWALMQMLKAEDVVGLTNLGENCLICALRIGNAELAFKFWEGFLKGKTQWHDPEQASLRRKVAELVQTHRDEGRMDIHKAKIMLRQLDGRAG